MMKGIKERFHTCIAVAPYLMVYWIWTAHHLSFSLSMSTWVALCLQNEYATIAEVSWCYVKTTKVVGLIGMVGEPLIGRREELRLLWDAGWGGTIWKSCNHRVAGQVVAWEGFGCWEVNIVLSFHGHSTSWLFHALLCCAPVPYGYPLHTTVLLKRDEGLIVESSSAGWRKLNGVEVLVQEDPTTALGTLISRPAWLACASAPLAIRPPSSSSLLSPRYTWWGQAESLCRRGGQSGEVRRSWGGVSDRHARIDGWDWASFALSHYRLSK